MAAARTSSAWSRRPLATAVDLVSAAERAASAGAKTFATWFGTSDATSVASRLATLTTVLDQRATIHDINSATSFEVDEELVSVLRTRAADRRRLPRAVPPRHRRHGPQAARGLVDGAHVAAVVEQMTDLAMVSDSPGARFIA